MRFVADTYYGLSTDTDAPRIPKNFTGSTNGSLTSFLGIPFAKPPYGSMTICFYHALTLAQHRQQTFQSP